MFAVPLLVLFANFHIDYSTYLGGSLDENAVAIAVDSGGNAYITGTTASPDFPLTSTAFGAPSEGKPCGFVTKLNSDASARSWSVCLANTTPEAISLDAARNVYVLAGANLVKLSPAADRIIYSKSLGVSGSALAVDAAATLISWARPHHWQRPQERFSLVSRRDHASRAIPPRLRFPAMMPSS